MINLSLLTDADKGRIVEYTPPHESTTKQVGVITSHNTSFIFVDYRLWGNTPQATPSKDLSFRDDLKIFDCDECKEKFLADKQEKHELCPACSELLKNLGEIL